MSEVIELSSDESEKDYQEHLSKENDNQPEPELICGLTPEQIEAQFKKYLQSHDEFQDIKRTVNEIARAQPIGIDKVNDLEKEVEQIVADIKRLGNPLDRVTDIPGSAEWDDTKMCLVVDEPIQREVIVHQELPVRPENPVEKDANADSGEGSSASSSDERDDIGDLRPPVSYEEVIPLQVRGLQLSNNLPAVGKPEIYTVGLQDFVFAAVDPDNPSSNWYFGTVINQFKKNDKKFFTVKFIRCPDQFKSQDIRVPENFVVHGKTQPYRLDMKQVVVAAYRTDINDEDNVRPEAHKAGVIAEFPSSYNGFRYLVFFADGKTGYVPHEEIFANFSESLSTFAKRISYCNQLFSEFLLGYFKNFPDRLLLKLVRRGKILVMDSTSKSTNPTWFAARVLKVTASMVKVRIKTKAQNVWIFRGSYLLHPIYEHMVQNSILHLPNVDRKPKKKSENRSMKIASEASTSSYKHLRQTSDDASSQTGKKNTRASRQVHLAPRAPIKGNKKDKKNIPKESPHIIQYKKTNGDGESDSNDSTSVQFTSDQERGSTSQREDEIGKTRFIRTKTTSGVYPDRQIYLKKKDLSCYPIIVNINENFVSPEKKSRKFDGHKECSPMCLLDDYDESMEDEWRDQNPYTIPLLLGWSREERDVDRYLRRRDKELQSSKDVFYRAPCGRSLASLEELLFYLETTDCHIPMDYFTFEPDFELYSGRDVIGCYYYDKDLSNGKERRNISVVNEENSELPNEFTYTNVLTFSNQIDCDQINLKEQFVSGLNDNFPFDDNFMSCCTCEDNCADPARCECQSLTEDMSKIIYPVTITLSYGYRMRTFPEVVFTGIYECNGKCSCDARCPNRVAQNGVRHRLQVFRTKKTGWGVRALHDIPKGTFICEYVAKVLTPEEGNDGSRNDMYFADLDLVEQIEINKRYIASHPTDFIDSDDEEGTMRILENATSFISLRDLLPDVSGQGYILDAIEQGNIGRFFNHSCDPNCVVQNVFYRTHDIRFPTIALFTKKTVKAFEELRWDYGYSVGSVEGRKLWCKCGSANCRKRLL